MELFNVAMMVTGVVFIGLGALILAFRSRALGVVQRRYASTAKRYEAAGRTPPTLTGTVPGSKFITFLGTAIILIGTVSLVLALTR
jgi:hypothetical protein